MRRDPIALADALPVLRAQWRDAPPYERREIEETARAVAILQDHLTNLSRDGAGPMHDSCRLEVAP